MILADTSVWIDHLRRPGPQMAMLLVDGTIIQHPYIVGELAVGNLPDRARNVGRLRAMQQIPVSTDEEFHVFLERQGLAGTGLGFVDIHLLAAVARQSGVCLWTRDKRLLDHAQRLDLAFIPP